MNVCRAARTTYLSEMTVETIYVGRWRNEYDDGEGNIYVVSI